MKMYSRLFIIGLILFVLTSGTTMIAASASGHGMGESKIELVYHCSYSDIILFPNGTTIAKELHGLVEITILNITGTHDEILEVNELYLSNTNYSVIIKNETQIIDVSESHLKINVTIIDADNNGYAEFSQIIIENTSWFEGVGIWFLDKNLDTDNLQWANATRKFANYPLISSYDTLYNEGIYHFEVSVYSEYDFDNDNQKERGITTFRDTAHYEYADWLSYYIHKQITKISEGTNSWTHEQTILIELDGSLGPSGIENIKQNSIYILVSSIFIIVLIAIKVKK